MSAMLGHVVRRSVEATAKLHGGDIDYKLEVPGWAVSVFFLTFWTFAMLFFSVGFNAVFLWSLC